ncbi:carbamoyl-phosphate synthase large subunit [Halobacteriovorax sp. GB3]|uniref:carbamoyl-phosphate synthase large subunit n=1 Tax=Halobacteriovorax sp. GB3 TaxID=2719615 RepID=UPI00235E4BC1|nr:carbamoyl-phosphate synthase large subunit [Halobacteriovorax sp. GB3]MDD0853058.1 carbamoyl-phosphate synthase large subunit [Halobacteriovorax sp. GB3]
MNELDFQKSLKNTRAFLHFKDGTKFQGWLNIESDDPRIKNGIFAEAAFTTGMSGYQETATDPSFLGQFIIYTNAHIGQYPSNKQWEQSQSIHAKALIARNFSANDFLLKCDVPLFSGLDTRSLVRYISTVSEDQRAILTLSEQAPSENEFIDRMLECNQLNKVSIKEKKTIIEGERPIALIDYGVKNGIIEHLKQIGLPLIQLPYNSSSKEVLSHNPRLIFLSNGPGDPKEYYDQIEVVKELLESKIPIRGICLGHQLLTLALGAKTIKLPFGQRGANHPVLDHTNGEILITSQNHGYASDEKSLLDIKNSNPLGTTLHISARSLFDKSVEALSSDDHLVKSVQYHPEANPGPLDGAKFFSEIKDYLENGAKEKLPEDLLHPLKDLEEKKTYHGEIKKILLIGSGPIKIGQASEFDYSGTQALKSLKEIGLSVVLLNSNPATIMTDPNMADATYIEPITKETIIKIIEKENVDALLSTMGGQTALNLCVELEKEGLLKERNVTLLGANVDTIEKTEDRELFAKELDGLGYATGKRFRAKSRQEALSLSKSKVGFPLIIRRDFALGGKGAALVHEISELEEVLDGDIKYPITMEKSLLGWKEVELEVMVDREKNGLVICSIENVDPCGIHTGDSITVAPAQTISDYCYQKLRTMSLTIAKHMNVVAGGANVQFAINPLDEDDIIVIEMNPRVSRSSALASKATGYPIAKISAQLAVGYTLKEILNDITRNSPVAFEPTLDYVAVKIPIFPFNKFPTSSKTLGPQMRSVGEVLALGSSFNEAYMKALRSTELGLEIPQLSNLKSSPTVIDEAYLEKRLQTANELSLLTVMEALRIGMDKERICELSNMTAWFVDQMEILTSKENEIEQDKAITVDKIRSLKELGFSDKHIALKCDKGLSDILSFRYKHNIVPVYKAVDTCSGEFAAKTPYFYSTYQVENEAISLSKSDKSVAIFGSGPNRIGQGIEFDYSCVKSCTHLRENSIKAIMINSNPETVSTDYDSSDRLYLSPLFSEDLFDILFNEKPMGVISSFSGQTGINIREHLEAEFRKEIFDINFYGPSLDLLDLTEDRKRFYEITKKVPLSHTKSKEVAGHKKVVNAMIEIGLPIIIRPSYVIGGESMYIFHQHSEIENLPETLKEQLHHSSTLFQVETYLDGALEYDVDLIRDHKGHTIFTVCEHIEHAGVHSGDSGMISPPVQLTSKMYKKMKEISIALANELDVIGPINFQYAVKGEEIYCIEANPRGSRTIPFLSKAANKNLAALATDALLGKEIDNYDREKAKYFCVKQSTFPFDRFVQDNIILGPKMRSTGETLGIDSDKDHAILKSYLGNYPGIHEPGEILFSLADKNKVQVLPYLKMLKMLGYEFIATPGTWEYIKKQGLSCKRVCKIGQLEGVQMGEVLKSDRLKMVFNTPENQGQSKSDGEFIRNSAIQYGVPCFTRPENIIAVIESIVGSSDKELAPVSLQEVIREAK